MRIVYLAWNGSIHTRRWVSFFAQRGHDVHVITCGDGMGDMDDDAPLNYCVHDIGHPRFGKVGYFFKVFAVRRLVRLIKPDLVHAHFVTSYGMLGLLCGLRPLVVTAHGDDLLISARSGMMRRLVRRVLQSAQIITVPSEQMQAAASELLAGTETVADQQVVVFQYGVETQRLAELGARTQSHRRDSGTIRIVSARPLLELYRIDVLIEAAELLYGSGVSLQLDIIGDGPERATLEQQVRGGSAQAFTNFHGHIPTGDVERMIAAADVYVSVAESDGASVALLEAMAIGTTPVLSNIPANAAWIESGVNGVLSMISAASLADAIGESLTLDPLTVARTNRELVFDRADRDANLIACELLIDSLVGVIYDPRPLSAGQEDAA